MIMNTFKKLIIILFLLSINQSVLAKPVPPGSGEGDVPANILILLDNSKSMKSNKIGLGVEDIRGATIDGSGNKILSSSSTHRGGLYFFDAAGDPLDFSGTRDDGTTYTTPTWYPSPDTDITCDYELTNDGLMENQIIDTHRRTAHVKRVTGVSMSGTNISGENMIFFLMWANAFQSKIVGLNESTLQCRIVIHQSGDDYYTRNFDIAEKDNEHILVALGTAPGNKRTVFTSCNLDQAQCDQVVAIGKHSGTTQFGAKATTAWDINLDNDASHVFVANGRGFFGFQLNNATAPMMTDMNNIRKNCPGSASGLLNRIQDHQVIDVKSDDNNIWFAASKKRRHIQRLTFPDAGGNCSIASQSTIGKKGNEANIGAAGGLAFNKVYLTTTPTSLEAIGDRVLITHGAYVDEFSGNKILGGQRDTAWQNQMGGGKMSRWDGAKKALAAVLSDSTLTSGANFGFGWWSAGENNRDGGYCDKNGKYCNYWSGWNYAANEHRDCNRNRLNACLAVPISTEGASDAINLLNTIQVRWGTDAHAWSHVAHGYFMDDAPNGSEKMYDPKSTCQLNYIIVISDGLMRNHGVPEISTNPNKRGNSQQKIIELREELGVKTLVVAYGDGIADRGMNVFDYLAMRGSCNAATLDEAADRKDCDPTIVAKTPAELKTKLASKIRQILAEKLAFTAPSITASIQEGGSLYQAQFNYEQYGEWHGTIKRREITGDGFVIMDHEDNWDASEKIRTQTLNNDRNIWTALPVPEETDDETAEQTANRKSLMHFGNWNNFNTTEVNLFAIDALFDRLGFTLSDYHNSSSECSVSNGRVTTDVGEDGTADELKGLINFIRGQDYFDYNGNCNITEVRDHVLGDIYHSQLIEIGPPDGNTDFNSNNEEAYYRSINNYNSFQTQHFDRKNIIYAGSNSGLLHAINAETGEEEWAFVPPFIAGKFPTVINPDLDGTQEGLGDQPAGGSNAIFGVDGSPVVHDVFIKGLASDGTLEQDPSWHTILFIPYGRGGSGFSVLDVTNPLVKDGVGPLHMFSVYNDLINNKVYVMNYNGDIIDGGFDYEQTQFNLSDSREAKRADLNYNTAKTDDNEGTDSEVYTNRSSIDECKNDSNYTGKFMDEGLTSCYSGKVFNFDNVLGAEGTTFSKDQFEVYKIVGALKTKIDITSAKMVGGYLQVKFGEDYTYNTGRSSDAGSVETPSSNVFISTSCNQTSGIEAMYDYSKLGETWSTPRIVRLPNPNSSTLSTTTDEADVRGDRYVAIMGAGMSSNYLCAGSALYLVELSDMKEPGKLFGYEQNKGPILIADTQVTDIGSEDDPNIQGSDITNAVPTNPIVITPDTAFGIPWRGALVYINDREGKITKINLTNMKAKTVIDDDGTQEVDFNKVDMFDQTTLYTLNANTDNKRYSFFSMDAGVGVTTKNLWLFGGTGNFNSLGETHNLMDNIMYGVRDIHYPSFVHLNDVHIPLPNEGGDFMGKALEGALNARSIDDTEVCVDATGNTTKISFGATNCPDTEDAWKVRLDSAADASISNHTYRKVSAPPTLFKGQVYYPIYEPPAGENKCSIGSAYICVADDECGTNNTYKLIKGASPQENDTSCHFVRKGVLSELVIFGDKLFANVAGPSDDEDTLYSILAAPGEVIGNSSGWRESGF